MSEAATTISQLRDKLQELNVHIWVTAHRQPCDEVRTKMKQLQEDFEATLTKYEAHVLEQQGREMQQSHWPATVNDDDLPA